jgi:hypothetical protein
MTWMAGLFLFDDPRPAVLHLCIYPDTEGSMGPWLLGQREASYLSNGLAYFGSGRDETLGTLGLAVLFGNLKNSVVEVSHRLRSRK